MTMSEYIRKPSQNYFEKFREGCLEKMTTEKEGKRERWGLSYTKKRALIGQTLAREDLGRGSVLNVEGQSGCRRLCFPVGSGAIKIFGAGNREASHLPHPGAERSPAE